MRFAISVAAVLAIVAVYFIWPGGASAVGETDGRARVVWNGVQLFGQARIENSSSASARAKARAGGVERDAIFLHPTGREKSLAVFPPVSVRLGPGEKLFFVGYGGIDDKVPWGTKKAPPDGVRFYVIINGQQVAQTEVSGSSYWAPMVAGPIAEAGAKPREVKVQVTLADDAGPRGNTSYDWALIGEPLLVAVKGSPPPGKAQIGVSGVVVFQTDGQAGEIAVEGLDGAGELVPGARAVAAVAEGQRLAFVRFDFSDRQECQAWRWLARGLKATAFGGRLAPSAKLAYIGTATAVVVTGQPTTVRVAVRNEGLGAILPEDNVVVECLGQRRKIERLGAGEIAVVSFDVADPEKAELRARLFVGEPPELVGEMEGQVTLWRRQVKLPPRPPQQPTVLGEAARDGYVLLANKFCCWAFQDGGEAARVWVWDGDRWEPAGTVCPLVSYVDVAGQLRRPRFDLRVQQSTGAAELTARWAAGGLEIALTARLAADAPDLAVSVSAAARRAPYELRALWGPEVHAGDLATGTDKGLACFPGLEFLYGDERSSSARDLAPPMNQRWLPHKFKVTVPMMMIETRPGGPTLAVMWDARQKWDGEHIAPAARFASPDFIHHQDNHLMQLGLPTVPDFMPENSDMAAEAVKIEPGRPWTLKLHIVAELPKPDATAVFRQFDELVGYPPAEQPPRDFEEEMALCRHGFMVTVWDEKTKKHRHCVGWGPANAPGFAALMLVDGRAVAKGDAKRAVLDRVDLIGRQTIEQQGEAGLASRANCHIMTWEFPYHWGHLPGALAGMRAQAYAAFNSQEADGGWGYYPDKRRRVLGEPGTRVIGIAARNAYVMAKWVAISGDPLIAEGLRKAIRHMDRFKVPRGAQGWECPILEPDVLAAAYAVRAYVWAYMALGDPALLDKARYWARTGLPFQYAWDDGQHPGMRYASIPVFGSTFFSHSWIGLPVQWCGLVYAYGLQELMRFVPDDIYRRQAEGITVSAMWQQWPMDERPELAGSYPDSFGGWFTRRNPAYLSPEDIAVNLLALHGLDPGLRSVRVRLADGTVHVTAPAQIKAVRAEGDRVQAELKYVSADVFYVSLGPVAVADDARVVAGGQTLSRRETLGHGEVGWTVVPKLKMLVVGLRAGRDGVASLEITGVRYSKPQAPKTRTGWEFEAGVEGWRPAHACTV